MMTLPKNGMFLLLIFCLAGCGLLGQNGDSNPDYALATANLDGQARVESAAGVLEFTTLSGLSGERLPGIQVQVAVDGPLRMIYAVDPTGTHLPVAVPLDGDSSVRRLVMPPAGGLGVNITTAYGALDTSWLDSIGMLSETDLRARLNRSGDEAVLIYFYNPMRPLALTGASLDAFATPFDNVIVLKARAEASDEPLGLLIVSLDRSAFADWAHINVDRYLAGRIGQAPITDLRTDLAFSWAYPVFDVFPTEENLELQGAVSADLLISWRSRNPDPPSPWSFFVTSDSEAVVITPDNFPLNPQSPPQTVTVTIDRSGLLPGEYTATLFIQPFSDTFGLIRQTVERTITFTVDETPPTPTPGPITEIVLSPIEPREGDNLSVSAEGFLPGESVLIELVGESRSIRDALPTASETGAFDYTIDLDTVPRGEYTLTLLGSQSFIRAEVSVLILEAIADAVVSRDELNLRFCPSFDCPVVEILARGDELTVIAVNSDDTWLEVTTTTGYQGWVLTNLVDLNIDLSTVPWNPNPPASP